ncbi:hypothetical protein [Coleofasciculus sp. H7-2]|uniref:hypothetical protein n=1 Tax=Coleofasciculus sp. H7-2 TaxID=3351545 RepID=UPI003670B318
MLSAATKNAIGDAIAFPKAKIIEPHIRNQEVSKLKSRQIETFPQNASIEGY